MQILDSIGESLSGLWDSTLEGGAQLIDAVFDHEVDKVTSAAPEENRVPQHEEAAQQPTGQPIHNGGLTTNTALMIGGGVIATMLVMVVLMKGK